MPYCISRLQWVNTLRPRQNGRHFADDILKCIFLNENVWIPIEISLKFVPKVPIDNILALVQITAGCRPGDKPLSEPMIVRLRIYASLGLNELTMLWGQQQTTIDDIRKNETKIIIFIIWYLRHCLHCAWDIEVQMLVPYIYRTCTCYVELIFGHHDNLWWYMWFVLWQYSEIFCGDQIIHIYPY